MARLESELLLTETSGLVRLPRDHVFHLVVCAEHAVTLRLLLTTVSRRSLKLPAPRKEAVLRATQPLAAATLRLLKKGKPTYISSCPFPGREYHS